MPAVCRLLKLEWYPLYLYLGRWGLAVQYVLERCMSLCSAYVHALGGLRLAHTLLLAIDDNCRKSTLMSFASSSRGKDSHVQAGYAVVPSHNLWVLPEYTAQHQFHFQLLIHYVILTVYKLHCLTYLQRRTGK